MAIMERKLYRSDEECMIFGVCGGIAEYLGLDPTLVRILCVLAAVLSSGLFALAYVVLAVIMPRREWLGPVTGEAVRQNLEDMRDRVGEMRDDLRSAFGQGQPGEGEAAPRPVRRRTDPWLIGPILVLAGVILLMDNLRVLSWWQFGRLWPLLLVGIGIALILRRGRRST